MTGSIGIFDSGLGGLTVAGEVLRCLPNESIIYFADTAHVPYGERLLEEIQEFALGITEFLIKHGAKAVVMACNMSSAVALGLARESFPDIPILGVIEPGSRAAVATRTRSIGVLATTGTVKSGAYKRTIHGLDSEANVWEQACPMFVPLVESGQAESEEAATVASAYVKPLLENGAGTLVLGCTHYPFPKKAISLAAPNVLIIDPAEETVSELAKTLSDRGLLAPNKVGEHIFYVSKPTEGFAQLGSKFLGRKMEIVEHVAWGVDLFPKSMQTAR